MKKNNIFKSISLLLMVLLLTTGCGKEIEVKNGSKVAVSTNKEKITATEYYEKIKENNIQILVEMIDKSFLDGKYKDLKKEEDEEVKKQIDQIKSYYGSNEETFKNVIRSYFGVETEEELEEKLRLEFKRTKAVDEYIMDELKDSEIEKYYEDEITGEIKASHILISVESKESATEDEKKEAEKKALEKAEEIIKKLNDGEKFATLAKNESSDKSNASNGGDLGYFELSDMEDEFADALKDLKTNEYTKSPVKTKHGYHIILKTGEKEKPKLKDVKDEIKETLKDKKLEEDSTLYYETLIKVREKNKISWNDTTLEKAYKDYTKDIIESAKSQNQ